MVMLLGAVALMMIVEGACFALAPEAMRRALLRLLELSAVDLRRMGLILMALGALLIGLMRILWSG